MAATATRSRTSPTTTSIAPGTALALDDAAGSTKREQTEREKSVERHLIRLAAASFERRGSFLARTTPDKQDECVRAVLELLAVNGFVVHRAYPRCGRCLEAEAMEVDAQMERLDTIARARAARMAQEYFIEFEI